MRTKYSFQMHKRKSGSSLLLVTCIGSIAVLMSLAVLNSLLDVYRHMASQYSKQQISTVCESTVQYTIARLNKASVDGDLNSIGPVIDIPESIKNGLNVNSSVDTIDISYCGALNAYYYPHNSGITFKRVLVTVSNGADKSKIEVILGPNQPIALGNRDSGSGSPPTLTPFFSNAIYSNGNSNLGSNSNIQYAPQSNINFSNSLIDSKGNLQLSDNNHIFGSISSSGNISASPNSTIDGDVHSAGTISDPLSNDMPLVTDQPVIPPTQDPPPTPNVLGDGTIGNTTGNIDNSITGSTSNPAPTPTTNGQADITGNQNSSNGAISMNVSPPSNSSPQSVYDLGSVNLSAGDSLVLNPGNYTVSSFNIGEGASLQISSPVEGQGVKIFVQGNNSNANAISISNNATFNNASTANNFQLFYNGNKDVNISSTSGKFNGLVYAPNANISLTGKLTGAFVGNRLDIGSNSTVLFDASSTNANSATQGASIPAPGFEPGTASNKQALRILSWQEFPRNKIP
ncbi:hypothetical protein KA183_14635 [bacterium]|nr:hypothetical protein [bacterium]